SHFHSPGSAGSILAGSATLFSCSTVPKATMGLERVIVGLKFPRATPVGLAATTPNAPSAPGGAPGGVEMAGASGSGARSIGGSGFSTASFALGAAFSFLPQLPSTDRVTHPQNAANNADHNDFSMAPRISRVKPIVHPLRSQALMSPLRSACV